MADITSANAEIALSVPALGILNVPLFGFMTDDAFTAEAYDTAETRMGVDGILSAGWVPAIKPFKISFQADSPSIEVFTDWEAGNAASRTPFPGALAIALPSLGKQYHMSTGFLKNVKSTPDGKKILDGQSFELHFQDRQVSPL